MELSVASDVEQLCIDAINAASVPGLAGLPVSTRIPVDKSTGATRKEFVRLWASNDAAETLVTHAPTVTVEGWADSESRAQRIMALAVAVLCAQEGALFGVRQIGGVGNNPHPDYPSKYRYSALLQARTRDEILPID